MIRIVLAEDQSLLRGALAALLSLEDDFEIVAEVEDGAAALRAVKDMQPDILVADIEMPKLSGLDLVEALARDQSQTRTVIVTTFARTGYLQRAVKAGVRGYLLKDAPSDQLVKAIRTVMAGGKSISTELHELDWGPMDPLSDRDRQILRLVEQGKSNKDIAQTMNYSVGTVRNYLSEALEKLGVSNRIEAFRLARANGWL